MAIFTTRRNDIFFDLLNELARLEKKPASIDDSTIEMAKKTAIQQFIRRKNFVQAKKKIDNSTLPAGVPVFTYCRHCGIPIEKLPEDYLFCPYFKCSQCSGLENEGWLEDAIAAARKNA